MTINGFHPLTPSEQKQLQQIQEQVCAFIPNSQQLPFKKLFQIKRDEQPPLIKIKRGALYYLRQLPACDHPEPLISSLKHKWITLLEATLIDQEHPERENLIEKLEHIKATLNFADAPTATIRASEPKSYTIPETIKDLAKSCQSVPSPENVKQLWTALLPLLKQEELLIIESCCADFQMHFKVYANWPFEKFYEIIYFNRDLLLHTPQHLQLTAAATMQLYTCFVNFTASPSQKTLHAFVQSWWYFAIIELDDPVLTNQIFSKYPQLNLNLPPKVLHTDIDLKINEIPLLAREASAYRTASFSLYDDHKLNFNAHIRCVKFFFQFCITYLQKTFPNFESLNDELFSQLIASYFAYYGTPRRTIKKTLINDVFAGDIRALKLLGLHMEALVERIQIADAFFMQNHFPYVALELLSAFYKFLKTTPNDAILENLLTNNAQVEELLTQRRILKLEKVSMHAIPAISESIAILLYLSPIETSHPEILPIIDQFPFDLTPVLEKQGPFATIDTTIAETMQTILQSEAPLKFESLQTLAFLWLEAMKYCIQTDYTIPIETRQPIIRNLNTQMLFCMPETASDVIESLIQTCTFQLITQTEKDRCHIANTSPFITQLNLALIDTFNCRPIITSETRFAAIFKTYPFHLQQACQAHLEKFLIPITRIVSQLHPCKTQNPSPEQEHQIYACLEKLHFIWLSTLEEPLKAQPMTEKQYKKMYNLTNAEAKYQQQAITETLSSIQGKISGHKQFCCETIMKKTDKPTEDFPHLGILKTYAERTLKKNPQDHAKFFTPNLGAYCTSLLGHTRLVSFHPSIQKKLNALLAFSPDVVQEAYQKRSDPTHRDAYLLCKTYETLIKKIATNADLKHAPARFVNCYMQFGCSFYDLKIPQLTDNSIQMQPDKASFTHWISLCNDQIYPPAAHFTADDLFAAYTGAQASFANTRFDQITTREFLHAFNYKLPALLQGKTSLTELKNSDQPIFPYLQNHFGEKLTQQLFTDYKAQMQQDLRIYANAFIEAADNLFLNDSEDPKLLDKLQLEWLYFVPRWHAYSTAPSPASIQAVKTLKSLRRSLYFKINPYESLLQSKFNLAKKPRLDKDKGNFLEVRL